ncbi:Ulp1 family isopeptidase [Bradyrhizobium sp. 2S1]|uniref:Ulp1 family isopeptidase n=1 Tax=Bradyrhizobium sp. 2S1 TaxID=1404429 RepID=UPI001CD04EFB|nr:Ulp1 family isopeptidase [Bradyrhizobium sp. 2S1]MCK7672769.1 C48 family peptidase [Bradyrhizobium sp. 2S1]
MDFPSIKWVREQSDSTGPQESSPAAPSADAATFERQLSEIANSNGGGGAMPVASALQPVQSAGVLKGRSKQPLYSEDARLISGLEEALRNGNAANHTAYRYIYSLRSFGRWLVANNKDPIAARLDDQSLTDDAREAIEKGHNRALRPAIDRLRTFQSTGGVGPIAGRAELNPHPQDVALIKEYKNEAATGTGKRHATALRSFSDYLRENNKKGIAARLSGNTLDEDVERYRKDAGGNPTIGAALADLRKSQAGAKAMERERHISPVPDPEDAALMEPMPAGGAAAQHSASQDAGSWPKERLPAESYDQDLLWELMDEPGPSSSLEPAARHDQSSDPGESIHPLNWGYDRQQFLHEPMAALARSSLLPSEEVLINDEHDTAELRPAKRPRTLDNLHGLASERQLSEIANSNGGGGAMPAASALQPVQSAGVLKGRSKQPLYSEDARLISGLEEALRNGSAANETAYRYIYSLRSFGRWLVANNKDPIAARLDDQSLTDDAREAIEKGHNRALRPAIDHLRTFQSTGGVVPITGRSELNPHPQDVALIKEYKNEAATGTGKRHASVLRSFSDYLRKSSKPGIAARLSGNTLDEDVKRYRKDAGGDPNIGAALADLRKSQAGAKAMELERHISPVPDPENAALMEPMPAGGAAAQHSASQDAGSWPKERLPAEGYDQDLLWELMDEPGPSSSLEPAARHDQSSDPGESIHPLNWGYDRQQFLDEPMAALARSNLLPSEEVLINDEHDTAELRPAKRPRTLDNLHGLAGERQLSEIANSNGGGGAMPAASALQPAQSAGVLIGRSMEPLYSEDARLISGLEEALRNGNAANQTAYAYVSSLRSFGRWLFANNKDPIAARLDDQSLTDDAREAIEKGHNRALRPAIDHLRTFQSTGGVGPISGRAELNPHPQDVALIEEYKNEAATGTGRMYASVLRSFSDYLRKSSKPGIAGRLSGNTLDEDVKRYRKDAGGDRNIGAALADLRKSQAGAKAMEFERYISPVPDPEDAALMEPWGAGGAAAQHSASQRAFSWPEEVLPVEGYDQDLLWELMDEPGPSSSLEPAARHDQSSDPGETIRPLNWGYDRQQFPDEPMAALVRSNLLPSEVVLINDEHDTAELRPAKRPRTLDNLHGLAGERQLSEIANSSGGGGAMPAASALQPAQSAGVLMGRSKQPLYSEDARLISGLEKGLIKGNGAKGTAKNNVNTLLSFGRWLFANNKDPIAARLDDQSLIDDAREFAGNGKSGLLLKAIDHLRTFHSTGGVVPIVGRAQLKPHPQDVALITEYSNEGATSKTYAVSLRSFSDYLRENNKKGIAGRLSGNTLDEDVKRYRKDAGGNRTIGAALADLRKSQAGAKAMEFERYISPVPDPEDAALMEPWRVGDAAAQHSASQDAGSWPEEVLPVEGYDQDLLWELMDEPGPSSSLEPAARHDQSSDPGETIRPLNWGYDRQQFPDESMGALARSNLLPSEEVLINDEHDTAELRPAKRPRPLDNLHGLAGERQLSEIANSGGRLLTSASPTHQQGASPWQAQPMMQASGHEDATAPHVVATYVGGAAAQHSAPQGARPLVLPEGYDQDLRLMVEDGPPWSGVPPEQAQDIVQAGQQEPARSTSTWSPQMPLNFDWSMWPTLEAAPAPAARARSDTYRGFPLVDLTAPTPSEPRDDANSVRPFPSTSADAQIGALGPTASSHGRGLVLEDTEWLGDEHIDRDYRLQELDLRRNHPDLAARTRFVNPLIVLNYLRSNDDGVVRTEFQRIVYDNGNDTADFLFLPVINADPEDPNSLGNHWSLLFVDRRDRGRPVAYHYDSYGGLNHKDAEHLAGRLDLRLEPAGMARQRNGYDCGVFVVDGTRALVRQLEQGREPDLLNLSNLVANRQALQNRLRG